MKADLAAMAGAGFRRIYHFVERSHDRSDLFVVGSHTSVEFVQLFEERLVFRCQLIWTARGLLSTVAAIRAPCSVKAFGR